MSTQVSIGTVPQPGKGATDPIFRFHMNVVVPDAMLGVGKFVAATYLIFVIGIEGQPQESRKLFPG